jgi:20S proteasome subunit alpha 7
MLCETDGQVLADRLSGYVQAYTCYGSVRPFGISTLVAGIDKTGPKLYAIEPSGVYYGYRATASGKGKALAKTELEKVIAKEGGVTVKEGVMELARM